MACLHLVCSFVGSKGKFISWEECKNYVKEKKIKTKNQWFQFTKSKNFPKNIPVSVNRYYKKYWKTWGDFLGTGFVAVHQRKYIRFEKARSYARSLKLQNLSEWKEHAKKKEFPLNIPKSPPSAYQKQWKGWFDFLGKKSKYTAWKYKKI